MIVFNFKETILPKKEYTLLCQIYKNYKICVLSNSLSMSIPFLNFQIN